MNRKWLKDFLILNLGTVMTAVGIYFFKFPNHFTTGGVSGISIVLAKFFPSMTTGTINLILNTFLLIIGFVFLGKGFGIRTAYASLMSSLITWILERVVPLSSPMTDQPVIELLFAVALPAAGAAFLFNVGASSGGTDILAMLVKKYTRVKQVGKALLIVDFLVVVSACFTFGMTVGLFSATGLFMKAFLVDFITDNIRMSKVCMISTANPQPILNYIFKELNHSATVSDAKGGYTNQDLKFLVTVVGRAQAVALQKYSRSVDPHCFITITNSSEIIGKGFRGMNE